MSNFYCELPLEQQRSPDDLLALIVDWVCGMPNSRLPRDKVRALAAVTDDRVAIESEYFEVFNGFDGEANLTGGNYVYFDDSGLRWHAEVVGRRDTEGFIFTARVFCESALTRPNLPTPKRPYIIKELLRNGWGAKDGHFPIASSPVWLEDGEETVAAAVIQGEAKNRLPIVYLSAVGNETPWYAVDPRKLAAAMAGLAHIVVEPSRTFSFKLAKITEFQNVYEGTIGIYWPDNAGRRSYYISEQYQTAARIERAIYRDVVSALANRWGNPYCRWQNIIQARSKIAVQKLREEKSTNVEAYVEVFDTEIAAKDAQIAEASAEIERLKSELSRAYKNKSLSPTGSFGVALRPGSEVDFYPNERTEVARWALDAALTRLLPSSRPYHVVQDLLAANEKTQMYSQIEGQLRDVLRKYDGWSARVEANLRNIGFNVSNDAKHVKVVFKDDPRYAFTIPKTPSDHRAGQNMLSDITRKLFLPS